ncbi:hypothetical protein TruAng_003340 [Truncatella angustata]|nr:hypothetical protein TruAng_003340 [Truncatella angustata]
MSSTRTLPELAQVISTQANLISNTYNDAGIQQPSLGYGTTHYGGPYAPALEDSRAQLLEAVDELRALIVGPAGHIFFMSFMGPAWTATLHVLYKFEIAKHVPLNSSISYADLADRCGLSEPRARRYVRSAISFRVFQESRPGRVQHNAASAILATSTLHDWIGMATEELAPAALKVAESMLRFPKEDRPAESAFAIANGSNGDKDLFAIVNDQPERMARLANAMEWSMRVPGMEPPYTVDHLGWGTGKGLDPTWCPRVVVDVGGGTGVLSKAMLHAYPNIEKLIVEDLPEVVTQAVAHDPDDFGGRLEYHGYNFFTEQTIKNADVYIWRCVFHDWPDSYAARILRSQIPALKPGARMIFLERCLEPPKPLGHMCANAKERSRDDWVALLAAADERFEIESISIPPHSALSIINVLWRGDETSDDAKPPEASSPFYSGSDVARSDSVSTFEPDSSSESESNCSHKRAKMLQPEDTSNGTLNGTQTRLATEYDHLTKETGGYTGGNNASFYNRGSTSLRNHKIAGNSSNSFLY